MSVDRTSSRLRKAYVAAMFHDCSNRWARARHSEAAAARLSGNAVPGKSAGDNQDSDYGS